MTDSVLDHLRSLNRPEVTDPEHEVTFKEFVTTLQGFLAEIILKDAEECDKLGEWETKIWQVACSIMGDHDWIPDNCGYWGHQYCSRCFSHKYPELGEMGCGAARKLTNNCTEEEYAN